MTSFRFSLSAAIAALVITFASPTAFAQTPDPEQPAQAAPQITDQQLETYAVAALEVQKINRTYRPMINKAGADEKQKILDKATQEMAEAIRDNGLSVEQYNQITTLVQSNPDLSKEVRRYMEENR